MRPIFSVGPLSEIQKYRLDDDWLFQKFKNDEDLFKKYIAAGYLRIAAEHYCSINLSHDALGEAWVYWLSDLERVLVHDTDTETAELDHFKHAAFLTFWLRRLKPLRFIFFDQLQSELEDERPICERRQHWFASYGNEICSVRIGLILAYSYEIRRMEALISENDDEVNASAIAMRRRLIEYRGIDPYFEADFVTTLKHKNNSPHSVNLIFKSIFRNPH